MKHYTTIQAHEAPLPYALSLGALDLSEQSWQTLDLEDTNFELRVKIELRIELDGNATSRRRQLQVPLTTSVESASSFCGLNLLIEGDNGRGEKE